MENKENILYGHIVNQKVIGSYEVKIIGEYKGKITVEFPIEKKYDGYTVYIRHMKHDGSIELFTRISKYGKVSVEVDELSPFILTIDKPIISEDGTNTSSPSQDQVQTGDYTTITLYLLTFIVSLGLITCIYLRRKYKKL